ncbi:MAG TPA: FAD-dependent oxidoreductase [Terriglobales bacterium]|jgi:monoamine oxidase
MDRRTFLKLGALSAAAYGLRLPGDAATVQTTLPRGGPPKRVVILGAGLSGLVAGYELTRTGHDVIILEAQRRPGGRVFTLRADFSDGLHAEAGAARIPDNHELTLHYAKLFGLTLDPFYPSTLASVTLLRGKRIRTQAGRSLDLAEVPLPLTAEEKKLGMSGMEKKYLAPSIRAMTSPATIDAQAYDRMTLSQFLRKQGASEAAIELLEGPFVTAENDRTSLLWLLGEFSHMASETTRYKIRGGNDQLPKAFAQKLAEKIHYGSQVAHIDRQPARVRVTVLEAGNTHVVEGDFVICCIPFPALRKVEVTPAFSEKKRQAIAELTYDSVTRVILQSRTRYWEKDGCNGFSLSDLPQEIWHPTFDQPGPRGLLLSYMFGALARRVAGMNEAERLAFVVDDVDKAHPGLRPNLEGAVTKIWDNDPWAGGAYALPSVGQMTTLCSDIARPEGHVHFAGEHTSGLTGWMQGALESGLRAAREVNEAQVL